MNLTRLENFKAIYEDGSVSAAARRLFIAQPALSNQLRAFEAELGVPLFERKSSALCPTAAGHALYRRAVQILSVVHASEQEMLQYRSGVKGVIRLGVVSSGGYALLTSDIRAFRARFPSIRFEIFDRNTYALRPMLQAGLIDIAIVRTARSPAGGRADGRRFAGAVFVEFPAAGVAGQPAFYPVSKVRASVPRGLRGSRFRAGNRLHKRRRANHAYLGARGTGNRPRAAQRNAPFPRPCPARMRHRLRTALYAYGPDPFCGCRAFLRSCMLS